MQHKVDGLIRELSALRSFPAAMLFRAIFKTTLVNLRFVFDEMSGPREIAF